MDKSVWIAAHSAALAAHPHHRQGPSQIKPPGEVHRLLGVVDADALARLDV